MEGQDDIQLRYEAPFEIFEKIYKEYSQQNNDENMLFDPEALKLIYNELQKKEIYLTSFISQGSQGAVFEALYNQEKVAIKCVGKVNQNQIKEEEKIIELLKGTPYVFKCIKEFYSLYKFRYYQISKRYQCSLKDIMEDLFKQKKTLPLNQIVGFALQMSSVFEKMQENKILHFDIKPENILYDREDKSFHLCHFGVSKIFKDKKSKAYDLKGLIKKYSAPEVLQDDVPFNIKFDIYGLGIILLEMTLGRLLKDEEYTSIRNGQLANFINKNQFYSDLNGIIKQMLHTQSAYRIDSLELTKQLNNLKIRLENQFISVVQGKLDSSDSNIMISKFKQSFLKFNYECKPNETRLDYYQFQGKDKIDQMNQYINKRLIHHFDLQLNENGLGADGAKNIGLSLEKCQSITSLNLFLQHNQLGADGVRNIGLSLEKCQSITSLNLDLSSNQLGADGARNIGQSLEKCQSITSLNLDLQGNQLGADGARNIGLSLEKCQNITSLNLNLRENGLGADGAKNIGLSLEKCQSITSLNLDLFNNQIGTDGARNIELSLEKCQNITSLNLNLWYYQKSTSLNLIYK